MNDLDLVGTDKTPSVTFNASQGVLSISGCSIPENADRFYSRVLDLLEAYIAAPVATTVVRIELTYFNSSSSKYLLDLFKLLEDAHLSGNTRVNLDWFHAADDLDMQEVGQDYRDLLEFPVKLVRK